MRGWLRSGSRDAYAALKAALNSVARYTPLIVGRQERKDRLAAVEPVITGVVDGKLG